MSPGSVELCPSPFQNSLTWSWCCIAPAGLAPVILLPQPPVQLELQVCVSAPAAKLAMRGTV